MILSSERCKWVKFLKFPIEAGIELVILLLDNSSSLRDFKHPTS